MTTATATSPATGAYPAITAAEDLLPLLREHQAWEEEHHRLAPEVVEAAGKAGCSGSSRPVRWVDTPRRSRCSRGLWKRSRR